jgi:hypothetical protein
LRQVNFYEKGRQNSKMRCNNPYHYISVGAANVGGLGKNSDMHYYNKVRVAIGGGRNVFLVIYVYYF